MYFLRLRPLKEDLVREPLPEREKFLYVMAWGVLGALVSPFVGISRSAVYNVVLTAGLLVITILGVRYAYRKNGREAGSAFLDRWFSIGWVVNLRVLLILYFVVMPVVSHVSFFAYLAAHVDYFFGTIASVFPSEAPLDDTGLEGLLALIVLAAEAYVVRAVGRHVGDVHAAADLGQAPAPVRIHPDRAETGPRPVPPGVLVPPAGLDTQTSQQLERFVETVVQRELATGATGPAAPRPRRPEPVRRARAVYGKRGVRRKPLRPRR